jgi:hypothetical protein
MTTETGDDDYDPVNIKNKSSVLSSGVPDETLKGRELTYEFLFFQRLI